MLTSKTHLLTGRNTNFMLGGPCAGPTTMLMLVYGQHREHLFVDTGPASWLPRPVFVAEAHRMDRVR